MNIYVSPELRERMREFDAVINWSHVASAAFEAEMIKHRMHVERMLRSRRVRRAALIGDAAYE